MRFSSAGRALLAAALLATVAACAEDKPAPSCPTQAQPGLAVAVGARANSPQPALPKQVEDYLTSDGNVKGVTVVRVDGAPSIACGLSFQAKAKNDTAKKQEKHDFGQLAVAQMRAVRSERPEADPLGALTLAADSAGPGGLVVLADSGLQTKAPLDFRTEALLFLSPDKIVEQLRASNLLPDTAGKRVVLSGIGYAADPQKQPHPGLQRRLVAIWTAIAKAGGSTDVQVAEQANTGAALTDKPAVSPVALPEPDPVTAACGSVIELPDGGAVGFQPDQAVYREPARARSTLVTVAEFLDENPAADASATGTIAHYGADVKDAGLALDRARTVTGTLRELGVSPDQLTAHGGGWGPYEGTGDAVDQRNRRVVLQISC
ncbi:porin [Paractinoplanes abujensis]|uniref:Outer membrane protein OmpA-like peptidoglycan-associated protein n=1 Tax=Paractinoplanes abujensis TaxID=882441 RepID=A0A7W7CK51_9ACTN|nr:hypothetical protein [Actinoplanes abujensis]MBB4690002.1 outer membrane protein OmpA-like peptidoglycan-associated protein [Actinoplanes abujensis]GID20775.1 porin [Actinoplanes abujensis]